MKILLLIKSSLNFKNLNKGIKNFMKITKQLKLKSNSIEKKVCNKFHSSLKLTRSQKKSSKQKETLSAIQSAKITTVLQTQVKV